MTSPVTCIPRDTSIETVAATFLNKGISGAPVIDDTHRPIGVISKTDLVREGDDRGDGDELTFDRRDRGFGRGFHLTSPSRTTAEQLMSPMTFSVKETASIAEAAALMAFEGVHRTIVINDRGVVVGLLSSIDVMRWLAESTGQLPLTPP